MLPVSGPEPAVPIRGEQGQSFLLSPFNAWTESRVKYRQGVELQELCDSFEPEMLSC